MTKHTVWKYEIPEADTFQLELPFDAKILSVNVQGGNPCIWAEVNPGDALVQRSFRTCGTGHDIPADEKREFIGTFLLHQGALVFHLFEVLEG